VKKRDLGPLPPVPPTRRALSSSRAALLEALRGQAEPVSLNALVASTGLHHNTVRDHVEALRKDGLVARRRGAAEGRGRPAWLYEATAGPTGTPGNEYAGLSVALAALIERTSDTPGQAASEAGFEWGRRLAAETGPPSGRTAAAARRQVVEILDRMGFAPAADRRNVETLLTRCPLLQAAHESPTVICNVHLGIVRGAMAAYGYDGGASELHPFSDPGACHLRLVADPPDVERTGAES
jgi:predicted ArsR family transcriptional regulator